MESEDSLSRSKEPFTRNRPKPVYSYLLTLVHRSWVSYTLKMERYVPPKRRLTNIYTASHPRRRHSSSFNVISCLCPHQVVYLQFFINLFSPICMRDINLLNLISLIFITVMYNDKLYGFTSQKNTLQPNNGW
jgi:hypothetical protein